VLLGPACPWPETERAIHFGVNFFFSPAAELSQPRFVEFQSRLATDARGLVFEQNARSPDGKEMSLTRSTEPLQVAVKLVGPNIGQLLIVASHPGRMLEEFESEAASVVDAYCDTWPRPVTVIRRDCTIRQLYAVREEHAFKFLWERRLHQREDAISTFKRPVLGGGIRLVFPPRADEPDDSAFEVKGGIVFAGRTTAIRRDTGRLGSSALGE
jgi:hypothetical protein